MNSEISLQPKNPMSVASRNPHMITFFFMGKTEKYISILVPVKGVNESSYSSSSRRILKFDSELIESSSSHLNSLSSRVRVSQYSTQTARELNPVLLFY